MNGDVPVIKEDEVVQKVIACNCIYVSEEAKAVMNHTDSGTLDTIIGGLGIDAKVLISNGIVIEAKIQVPTGFRQKVHFRVEGGIR